MRSTQLKPCLRRGQGWGSGWGGSGSKAETKAEHGQVAMERGWESRWTESSKSWANSNTGAPGLGCGEYQGPVSRTLGLRGPSCPGQIITLVGFEALARIHTMLELTSTALGRLVCPWAASHVRCVILTISGAT